MNSNEILNVNAKEFVPQSPVKLNKWFDSLESRWWMVNRGMFEDSDADLKKLFKSPFTNLKRRNSI